jgi:hypothetical protein
MGTEANNSSITDNILQQVVDFPVSEPVRPGIGIRLVEAAYPPSDTIKQGYEDMRGPELLVLTNVQLTDEEKSWLGIKLAQDVVVDIAFANFSDLNVRGTIGNIFRNLLDTIDDEDRRYEYAQGYNTIAGGDVDALSESSPELLQIIYDLCSQYDQQTLEDVFSDFLSVYTIPNFFFEEKCDPANSPDLKTIKELISKFMYTLSNNLKDMDDEMQSTIYKEEVWNKLLQFYALTIFPDALDALQDLAGQSEDAKQMIQEMIYSQGGDRINQEFYNFRQQALMETIIGEDGNQRRVSDFVLQHIADGRKLTFIFGHGGVTVSKHSSSQEKTVGGAFRYAAGGAGTLYDTIIALEGTGDYSDRLILDFTCNSEGFLPSVPGNVDYIGFKYVAVFYDTPDGYSSSSLPGAIVISQGKVLSS